MNTSLDDILNGNEPPVAAKDEPAPEVKDETVEAAAPETAETPVTETPGTPDEPAAETPEAAPAKPDEPEKPAEPEKMVPHAALHETREQLKKARQQNEELTGLFKKLEPHLTKPEKPEGPKPPDFYADPQAFVTEHIETLRNESQVAVRRAVLNMSEANARARHEDFEPTIQRFAGMVEENPDLRGHMLQQPDPGEWAYRMAKRHEAMQALGDPVTARERLKAELRAELEAEHADEAAQVVAEAEEHGQVFFDAKPEAPAVPALPKSLAKTRNAGARKGPAWSGPTPLDEVLKPIGA